MSVFVLSRILSVAFAGFIAVLLFYILIKSNKSVVDKIILCIPIVLVSFLVGYYLDNNLYEKLANLMPMRKDVPCFILNEKNCIKRSGCELLRVINGFWCFDK